VKTAPGQAIEPCRDIRLKHHLSWWRIDRHACSRRNPGRTAQPRPGLPGQPFLPPYSARDRRPSLDIYHAWCDLKPGVTGSAFAEEVAAYLGHLKSEGLIAGWRLTRRKLGLGAPGLGEFHLMMEVRDLAQLDE